MADYIERNGPGANSRRPQGPGFQRTATGSCPRSVPLRAHAVAAIDAMQGQPEHRCREVTGRGSRSQNSPCGGGVSPSGRRLLQAQYRGAAPVFDWTQTRRAQCDSLPPAGPLCSVQPTHRPRDRPPASVIHQPLCAGATPPTRFRVGRGSPRSLRPLCLTRRVSPGPACAEPLVARSNGNTCEAGSRQPLSCPLFAAACQSGFNRLA